MIRVQSLIPENFERRAQFLNLQVSEHIQHMQKLRNRKNTKEMKMRLMFILFVWLLTLVLLSEFHQLYFIFFIVCFCFIIALDDTNPLHSPPNISNKLKELGTQSPFCVAFKFSSGDKIKRKGKKVFVYLLCGFNILPEANQRDISAINLARPLRCYNVISTCLKRVLFGITQVVCKSFFLSLNLT